MGARIRLGRGHRSSDAMVYLKMLRSRARLNPPPPNPLADPIAHIKQPLQPAVDNRRGRGVGSNRHGQGAERQKRAVIEFSPQDVQDIRGLFLATQEQFAAGEP